MARELYDFGPYQLDPMGRRLLREGSPVSVTPKALDTLKVLVEQRGRRLSRQELIAEIWPDTNVGEHNLNQTIAVLRKALDDDPRNPTYIATLPGHGYCFVAEVACHGNGNGNSSQAPAFSEIAQALPAPRASWKPTWMVGAVLLILVAAGWFFLRYRPLLASGGARSITVLPLVDLSSGEDDRFIADGLSGELSSELGELRDLRVVVGGPREQVARTDVRELAQRLNVATLLQGSLRRSGGDYRIAVQLVRGQDGRELWAGVYTGNVAQLPGIEEQIVRQVASKMRVSTSAGFDEQLARRGAENPKAHELYLEARYLWSRRDADKVAHSIDLFQQAIVIDPGYARAYSGLADAYAVAAINLPLASDEQLAVTAAYKALDLDPMLAEPHATLGLMKDYLDWDHHGASEEFSQAVAINPGYATAHHWHGLNLTSLGEFEAADQEFRRAQELDPLSPMISEGRFENFYYWHRFDDAIQTIQALQKEDPDHTAGFNWALARAYAAKGMYAQAKQAMERQRDLKNYTGMKLIAARIDVLNGQAEEPRAELAAAERGDGDARGIAALHLALGEPEAALKWLNIAFEHRQPDISRLRWDPEFSALRGDPRFASLLQQIDQASASRSPIH